MSFSKRDWRHDYFVKTHMGNPYDSRVGDFCDFRIQGQT